MGPEAMLPRTASQRYFHPGYPWDGPEWRSYALLFFFQDSLPGFADLNYEAYRKGLFGCCAGISYRLIPDRRKSW